MANPITPELFTFFRALKRNNDREWFEKNKARYESVVREPLLAFIADFAEPLAAISAHYVADARRSGGSLFRIYRDTRFSHDKTPYKTAAGVHFRHRRAKDAHAPGFYLHLEPGGVFAGVGLWAPEAKVAQQVREAIAADAKAWTAATRDAKFAKAWTIDRGEALKRPPRGVAPDHPLVDDLRLKQFIAVAPLTEEEACAPDFPRRFARLCESAATFMRFLTEAVGESW